MIKGRWSVRDGIKGDAAIEDARRDVEKARSEDREPNPQDVWLAAMKTSYET